MSASRKTKRSLLLQLKNEVDQRHNIDPYWFNVISNWIDRFQQFTIDLTGTYKHENQLLEQACLLLATQSQDCDNKHLCDVLSTEFEGLYWRAEVGKMTWSVIDEPYISFKLRLQKSNTVFDIYASEQPQVSPQVMGDWLINRLNECRQTSILGS